jgi:hypothetical protein
MPFHQVRQLAQIINYKPSKFSLTYLGLSLSNKALSRHHYQNLVDNIQDRLPRCYANKLSIAGGTIILNSVLSAMSVYFMSIFLLSDWVIKAIDKV